MTLEEVKQSPAYRWVRELHLAYQKGGVKGEPVEIPMKAVMDAPLPDYLPVSAAVRVKFMFMFSIYQNGGNWGAMQDATVGVMNMMILAMEDNHK